MLATHAEVMQGDVSQIMSVLKSMRAYAAAPDATITEELVCELVDESIRTVVALAERLGVPVENHVAKDLALEGARVRLIQALSNVLHNALEAYNGVDRRDPIIIEGSASGDLIRLSIRDFGCGMSTESDARALFATQKAHGSGIGLPLAIKIVDSEHDGELTIESVEGEGTTIAITLPRFQRSE